MSSVGKRIIGGCSQSRSMKKSWSIKCWRWKPLRKRSSRCWVKKILFIKDLQFAITNQKMLCSFSQKQILIKLKSYCNWKERRRRKYPMKILAFMNNSNHSSLLSNWRQRNIMILMFWARRVCLELRKNNRRKNINWTILEVKKRLKRRRKSKLLMVFRCSRYRLQIRVRDNFIL